MWSTGLEENNNNNITKNTNERAYSSFSKSSSSPSSSATHTATRKTMEEIWKDIDFASLPDNHHHTRQVELARIPPPKPNTSSRPRHHRNTSRAGGAINLQGFLARPFHRDQLSSFGTTSISSTEFCHFGSSAAAPPPPAPPPPPPLPPTCLSLNSGADEFHYFDNSRVPHGPQPSLDTTSLGSHPYDAFVSSSSAFLPFCNNRRRGSESEENTVDLRRKRIIKNRESAARSRARKQSYTQELENQVATLTEQNERLVEQHKQLCLALADQFPKKRTLQRSSTALF